MNDIGEIEFIDSHCHLDYEQLSNDLQSIIKRAKEFNVNKLITICTSLEEIKRFYRLKTFVRPASPPKWIFETGLGRDIGGNNILPPNIVGPINPGQ